MTITWDKNKNALNKTKHHISFEAAQLVFEDPFQFSHQDRIVGGEERWQTIGLVSGMALLLVAHTWNDQEGGEHIRIVSARRADKIERERYENNA